MNDDATPGNVPLSDGLGRCACPPMECHGVGKGPANCAAMAARQEPIAEARYVSRLEAALRMMVEAPNDAALEHARGIAKALLRHNVSESPTKRKERWN